MNNKNIPLFKVYMPDGIGKEMEKTLFSGYIAEGKKTGEFRDKVAGFINNPRTALVNSGTTAIQIAYHLSSVGPGDEVISTPLTSIATNVPILHRGAKPVWADVNPESGISDIKDIERLVNRKTKAILILHKDGDIEKLNELVKLAKEANIPLIEDAAHAFGALYDGRKIGNHGDFICFSFQAIKHITTGDGGALSVKDEKIYDSVKKLKWFGVDHDKISGKNPWLDDIENVGYKGNMNDIASTIGIEQIKNVDWIVKRFHENGEYYNQLLEGNTGIKVLARDPKAYSTYWTYTFLSEKRDGLIKYLNSIGIGASLVHPRNDVWSIFKDSRRNLSNVDYFTSREVSIPSGWWVEKEDIEMISDIIIKFHKN